MLQHLLHLVPISKTCSPTGEELVHIPLVENSFSTFFEFETSLTGLMEGCLDFLELTDTWFQKLIYILQRLPPYTGILTVNSDSDASVS